MATCASCLLVRDRCGGYGLLRADEENPYSLASGDIRNVVKTIADLPASYGNPIEITINDRDFDIVARNIIMLLIALVVENIDEAVECIIHVWYSAFLRESDMDLLQHQIRPLIESLCDKVKNKAPKTLLGKTWTFGRGSLRVVLEKSSWDRLLSFLHVPEGLTVKRAREIRTAITLAESRRDYRDRQFCCQSPSRQIALRRFLVDGLSLPNPYP